MTKLKSLPLETWQFSHSNAYVSCEKHTCSSHACPSSIRNRSMPLSLLVYNVSLVDRVQTYGPEFEMLLSSHDVNGESQHGKMTSQQ